MAESSLKGSPSLSIRRAGKSEKIITLLLIFILLTAAAASISAVLTGPNWSSLWESLLFGMLAGWLLAIFRVPAWRSALIVIILGVLFCLLAAGGLSEKIRAVVGEFLKLAAAFITTFKIKELDTTPIATTLTQLVSASVVVSGRVASWIKDLTGGQPNYDPVAAGIVWSMVVWLVAGWAGWVVEATKNALAAALPALLLCLSTLSYVRNVSATIYLLLGLTLVLVAVVQYDHREQLWDHTGVAYPARKAREVGNVSLVLTLLLVLLAAILSSISIQSIIRRTSQRAGAPSQGESGLAKSLGIAPAATPTADPFSTLRSPGLPRELLIGSGPELSGEQVMTVQVDNLASLVQGGQLPPLYWRSFTYDNYTGHGWKSSATQQIHYTPGQSIGPDQLPEHILVQEKLSLFPGAEGSVYGAGETVSVDASTEAAWRSDNDLFGIQTSDQAYTIQSLVPAVDEPTMRQAGQDYPGWVVQRYLAVPTDVPARVKELAIQLTATEPTPYDRAHAIEEYLRQRYPYTLDVPRPPANQDLVDYFLFDLRKGYCDYYASAMVILARSAGLPARLAIGYATGDYNLNSKRFLVTQAEAHSWPEIYFPGIGWVPFEPTAGLPAINHSAQPTQAVSPVPTPPVPAVRSTGGITFGKYVWSILLALLPVFGLTWVIWDEFSLRTMKPDKLAREVYRRMRRYAQVLRTPMEDGDTPFELAGRLATRISEILAPGKVPEGVQTANDWLQALTGEIVRQVYGYKGSKPIQAAGIASQWAVIRWRLRWLWLRELWARLNLNANEIPDISAEGKPPPG